MINRVSVAVVVGVVPVLCLSVPRFVLPLFPICCLPALVLLRFVCYLVVRVLELGLELAFKQGRVAPADFSANLFLKI